jgi:RRXRR protein
MTDIFVPVVDQRQHPLMPTTPARARRWLKSGKATSFWQGGIFCVRLNVEPSAHATQPIAVGIDPGSKREGLSAVSAAHTYLNIQAQARTGVQEVEQQSTRLRRTRRTRQTPCRQPRQNRHHARKKVPPSTKARWQWKLRLATFLCRLFPVTGFVVEDIKASTRPGPGRKWNRSFSPLEVGKLWFYNALHKLAPVTIKQGWETKTLREQLGLKKTSRKLAEVWEAHSAVGGKATPDNTRLVCIAPLLWHRRQLHRLQAEPGGKRKPYGGTLSQGIKRGTLVHHPKWGKAYVGGQPSGRVSLHDPHTGKRLTQGAKMTDCRMIKLLRWRTRLVPFSSTQTPRKERVFPPVA